jgi:NAD(P)H-dependent flavin oxidoreductase YrpB (nitropropane dioxygenase family)
MAETAIAGLGLTELGKVYARGRGPSRFRGAGLKTEVCGRFGIEFPLFAFSHSRDVVAAVTNAGGFGVLGAVAYSPDRLEEDAMAPIGKAAEAGNEGARQLANYFVGQVVGQMNTVKPARQVVYDTIEEFADALERLNRIIDA